MSVTTRHLRSVPSDIPKIQEVASDPAPADPMMQLLARDLQRVIFSNFFGRMRRDAKRFLDEANACGLEEEAALLENVLDLLPGEGGR